jgi:peptidoglycan/LPS O-acetylase OafA/YrhL
MRDYRADIDGLRAIAVLAVILFHAGLPIPGGFVGVDVFFVISGYLITGLVADDLQAGRFSLGHFWERRIRRIWPAALATIAASLAVGWFVMLPQDYRRLSVEAIAQLAMAANVFSWYTIDYFSPAAELRPLMHTWSLAVEEQFYILHPLVLAAAFRLGRRRCITVLSLLAMASLAASILLLERRPMTVFYLLPCRAWEMLLGAIVAIAAGGPRDASTQQHVGAAPGTIGAHPAGPRWIGDVVGAIGLALVLIPCLAYDTRTPFPGLAALPPCLGTAALIVAGGAWPACGVSRLLALAPLRAVGLASYSLYLWHWPALAFLRYCLGTPLPAAWIVVALVLTAVLGVLSWRFVETPFRRIRPSPSPWRTGLVAAAASLALATCSAAVRHAGGVPGRFPEETLALVQPFCTDWECVRHVPTPASPAFPAIGAASSDPCKCFLLWGDSHGMAICPAIDAAAREAGVSGVAALVGGTVPLPGFLRPANVEGPLGGRAGETDLWGDGAVAWIRTCRPRHVLLCARWSAHVATATTQDGRALTQAAAAAALKDAIVRLRAVCDESGTHVWLLLEVPYQDRMPDPRQRVLAQHWLGRGLVPVGVDRRTHEAVQRGVLDLVEPLAGERLHLVDLAEPFFDADGVSRVGPESGPWWYTNADHISPTGAHDVLEPLLRPLFQRIAADCEPR